MSDLEDIKKLENIIKSEHSQENDFELAEFLGDRSEDDMNQYESYTEEVEQDVLEHEKQFESFHRALHKKEISNDSEIIDDCKDIAIKNLMILNRNKSKKIKELVEKTYHLLMQCQRQISYESETVGESTKVKYLARTYAWKVGIPYFKDKYNYGSPSNDDVNKKIMNKELFVHHLPALRKWSISYQNILKKAIIERYFQYNLKNAKQKQSILKIKHNAAEGKAKTILKNELDIASKEVDKLLKENHSIPPYGCNDCIDWNWIADNNLKGRYTAGECYAFWNIYLHPDINKDPWTTEEDEKLKEIVANNRFQDWDNIAQELNTGRTSFTACIHYFTTLNEKFIRSRFNEAEDVHLLNVIEKYRVGNYIPWGKVSQYFQNRSRTQLYNRYRYFLQNKEIKKGLFSEAEDVLLKLLVRKFKKSFSQCAKYLQNRTIIQVRNRYERYLRKRVHVKQYTLEEDLKIMDHVEKHGRNWKPLIEDLNRVCSSIRNRHNVLSKWLSKNPDKDLSQFPRKAYRIQHYKQVEHGVTEKVFERLSKRNSIPSFDEIERICEEERLKINAPLRSRIGSEAQFAVVDTELREFFKTYHKSKPLNMPMSEVNTQTIATATKVVLDSLGATFLTKLSRKDILNNENLDNEDKKILHILTEENIKHENLPSTSTACTTIVQKNKKVLPPNIHTLIGFRDLLLKHQTLMKQLNEKSNSSNLFEFLVNNVSCSKVRNTLKEEMLQMDADTKKRVVQERKTFVKRFYTLFRLPAIMSLLEPKYAVNNEILLSTCEVKKYDPMQWINNEKPPKPKTSKIALANPVRYNNNRLSKQYEQGNNINKTAKNSDKINKECSNLEKSNLKLKEPFSGPLITYQRKSKTAKIDVTNSSGNSTENNRQYVEGHAVFIKNESRDNSSLGHTDINVIQENRKTLNNLENSKAKEYQIDTENIMGDIRLLDAIIKSEKHS